MRSSGLDRRAQSIGTIPKGTSHRVPSEALHRCAPDLLTSRVESGTYVQTGLEHYQRSSRHARSNPAREDAEAAPEPMPARPRSRYGRLRPSFRPSEDRECLGIRAIAGARSSGPARTYTTLPPLPCASTTTRNTTRDPSRSVGIGEQTKVMIPPSQPHERHQISLRTDSEGPVRPSASPALLKTMTHRERRADPYFGGCALCRSI